MNFQLCQVEIIIDFYFPRFRVRLGKLGDSLARLKAVELNMRFIKIDGTSCGFPSGEQVVSNTVVLPSPHQRERCAERRYSHESCSYIEEEIRP